MSRSRTPIGLDARGKALWRDVLAAFELSDAERSILVEACRVADLAERLAAELAGAALTVEGSRGQVVVNPVAAELRQQRDLLARLLGRLALPPDDDEGAAASRFGRQGAAARWNNRRS